MSATNSLLPNAIDLLSKRKAERFRQAAARRRIQGLRDEKLLQGWLTEVWDETPSLTEFRVPV
jgi:hypothetical protein